jgi:hypothetical protein
LNSHTVEINLILTLEAPRDVLNEIYEKDRWKKQGNCGSNLDNHGLNPFLFIFAGPDSMFPSLSNKISLNGRDAKIKQSLIHWDIWLPFSTREGLPVTKFNNKTFRNETRTAWFNKGRLFSGRNCAIFSELEFNTPISVSSTVEYQNLSINKASKGLSLELGILLPFRSVVVESYDFIPPVGFSLNLPLRIDSLFSHDVNKREDGFALITPMQARIPLLYGANNLSNHAGNKHLSFDVDEYAIIKSSIPLTADDRTPF